MTFLQYGIYGVTGRFVVKIRIWIRFRSQTSGTGQKIPVRIRPVPDLQHCHDHCQNIDELFFVPERHTYRAICLKITAELDLCILYCPPPPLKSELLSNMILLNL
jgi:hypothetical protein